MSLIAESTIHQQRPPAGRWPSRLEVVLAGAALIVTGWFWYFTVASSGLLVRDAGPFNYYNLLVDGFRSGHLYLSERPSKEFLALRDPYDPAANDRLRLPDACYYRGHYYIYFGVTPAILLMLPYTLLTGQHMAQAAALLIFCFLGLGAASTLWLLVRARYFPRSAWWLPPVGIGVLGFGTHVLALLRRPSMWELPIGTSFGLTMLALLSVYLAIHDRRTRTWMALAGMSLGLAVGARPTAILAAGMLLAPIGLLAWQRQPAWKAAALAAAIPFVVILAGLAWYNYARFDSPFQFGQSYQLTGLREGSVDHFSPRFLLYNVRIYFGLPVDWTPDWPFISAARFPPCPRGYFAGEELYWLAVLFPIVWFTPVGTALVPTRRAEPGLRAIVAAALMAEIPILLLILSFFSATERYMVEFLPGLIVLALFGILVVENAAATRKLRQAAQLLIGAVAAVVILFGVLASFDYHRRSMRDSDPATWQRLANATEPVVHRVMKWLGHPATQPPVWPGR